MFSSVLVALTIILYVALAVVLVRKYLRTRDVGFVWLGVAVIIWPIVSRVLLSYSESILMRRLSNGQPVGFYPFSLVEGGHMTIGSLVLSLNLLQQLIGNGLLLVAVFYLYKSKDKNRLHPTIQ